MAIYQIETDGGTYQVETDESTPPVSHIGGLESFGRAAVNNLPLGGQIGAAGTAFANSEDYQKALAEWNAKAAEAKAANPKSYGAGAVAGTLAPLAIPGVGELGIGGQAALGAAYGVGNTDLTDLPQVAKDAAIGGVTGGAIGAAGKAVGAAADTVGQYAGRFGENQTIKALGGSGGQIRQLGVDESRDLARRAANDYGLLDATMGPIGREQTVSAMGEQAGHDIGEMRDAASAAGQAMSPQDLVAKIRENIGHEYDPVSGVKGSEANGFEKVLRQIEAMKNPTYADYAQKATDLNHYAAGNKLIQPTNAETDVANQLAHFNDEGIKSALPDMADQYDLTKGTFQDMKNLAPMIERGESRQMASRGGNTAFEQGRKFTEELGAHKLAAKAGFGMESALNKATPTAIARGGVVTSAALLNTLHTNPKALGRYAAPLAQAGATGGAQGIAAMHYVLSSRHPDYNEMTQGSH